MGLTFNDLIMGLVSKSIKTHFVAQGDSTEEIGVAVPFSYQSIPQKVKDYTFGNNFVPLVMYLDLKENFNKEAFHKTHKSSLHEMLTSENKLIPKAMQKKWRCLATSQTN